MSIDISEKILSTSGEPISEAEIRLIGPQETMGTVKDGAILFPGAIVWNRTITDFEGHRWNCWLKFVAQQVSGITFPEFAELMLTHNPSLLETRLVLQADRIYLLPQNKPVSPEITWEGRLLTDFSGSRWECWVQFVENKVLNLTWHAFKDEFTLRNPQVEADAGELKTQKSYKLPRNTGDVEYYVFAISSPTGLYRFRQIPPGQYRLEARARGYRTLRQDVVLTPATGLELRLEPLPDDERPAGMVQAENGKFVVDGQEFRFVGVNIRTLVHYGDKRIQHNEFSQPDDTVDQLEAAHKMKARVVRCFVANRFQEPGEVIQRLKHVLKIMDNFPGMYLLPALTDVFSNTSLYPKGDKPFYDNADGKLYNNRQFFDGGYKENYLPFVKHIVHEFRNEPRIFAWEIGNEVKLEPENPHDPDNDPNPRLFIQFIKEVSEAIKAIDPLHIVTTGMVSTCTAWLFKSEDKRQLYGLDTIDFITVHIYDAEQLDQQGDPCTGNRNDGLVAKHPLVNKPFIVEEAGFKVRPGIVRPQAIRADLEKWFDQNQADGYMQWGFMARMRDGRVNNGDGDDVHGMDRFHFADWDDLFDLYKARAEALGA
jgi:hypothetical protein